MNTIESLQQWLKAEGIDPGPIDGADGPKTFAAWSDYLATIGQTANGASNTIESLQRWLKAEGIDPGPIDGADGPKTFAAWSDYQAANGASNTTQHDSGTHDVLPVPTNKVPEPAPSKAAPVPAPVDGDFETLFPWIIKWEGSEYENVPGDNGGPTKYGIDSASHPGVSIRALTLEGAKSIYHSEWLHSFASKLPHHVNLVYFNYRVNTGEGRAAKFLQEALGITADGAVGPATKAAAEAITNGKQVATKMVDHSDAFYRNLASSQAHDAKFLKGWLKRNDDLRKTFLA